ncbi:type IV conjugative transfer system lipoprotein TraV [Roseibium sp. RKSG952]|uniref:type IV conjugative transfer system lipoprotein TraV n=1 Tax=Roseibium sp. RKSG952 TaxID=2529384 RepID=UPI001AD8C5DF
MASKLPLLAALSAFTLAGCASPFNIGSSDYACPGMPSGVACKSARDVYAMTNDGQVPAAMNSIAAGVDDLSGDTPPSAGTAPIRNAAFATTRTPTEPIPVRTPAQVMRIWIAPREDVNGDLHVSSYVFTEIEPRRWSIGTPAPQSTPKLNPLTTAKAGQ